ncbi:MAG: LptA/OstA family protein [Gemmataceae bacterium]
MWTPKRILLLIGGFVLFLAFYLPYAYFLGGIDGLPPLPKRYYPPDGDGPLIILPKTPVYEADRKLRVAFGPDCPEVEQNLRVEVRKKRFVFSTNGFNFETDGRVKFKPFSIALFREKKNGDLIPEINTIRAKEAYLQFDRPIRHLADIGNRKIVGAELRGDITIINNRKTPYLHDDIEVFIPNAPLEYNEAKNLITTRSDVKLLDKKSAPHPTKITARGMDIFLTKGFLDQAKQSRKTLSKRGKNSSGVEKIVLRRAVNMHFHIDAKDAFLGGATRPPETAYARVSPPTKEVGKAAALVKPKKSHVAIMTLGSFVYDVSQDKATFESPNGTAKGSDGWLGPPQVTIMRTHEVGIDGQQSHKADELDHEVKNDQLVCDRLELQFRTRRSKHVRPGSSFGAVREIAQAIATCRKDNLVRLAIDNEALDAEGTELIYMAPTKDRGAQTILRGTATRPIRANKDAHKLVAQELRLVANNSQGYGQNAVVQGPGRIDLVDRNNVKQPQYHAVWKHTLVVTKDTIRDPTREKRTYDLLTFTGDAGFIDDAHKQQLHAEKIQVWVEPPERENADELHKQKKHKAVDAPRQQPHKLLAFRSVRINSPDLHVEKCDRLLVHFRRAKSGEVLGGKLPELADAGTSLPKAHTTHRMPPTGTVGIQVGRVSKRPANGQKNAHGDIVEGMPNSANGSYSTDQDGFGTSKRLKTPIHLQAQQVTVEIVRNLRKHQLQDVLAEGEVRVWQAPSSPEKKGVRILGSILRLLHHQGGEVLTVYGDAKKPAELKLDELVLVGPKVTIDQEDNTAKVDGIGAMILPSNTTFEGTRPAEPGAKLTVQWTQDMSFTGREAYFRGAVVAHQDSAVMKCQNLRVSLDRSVSFKEGQEKGKGAKVERIICFKKVYVANVERDLKDPNKKLIRYERLLARELSMNDDQGGLKSQVRASGPGQVILLQHGTVAIGPQARRKPRGQDGPAETNNKSLHRTLVQYEDTLLSYKKDDARYAKFFGNVHVYHGPANHPETPIDASKLKPGEMFLRCGNLTIYSQPTRDKKVKQYLKAENKVRFRTDKIQGQAARMFYDQQREVLFLYGLGGNVVLYENAARGNDRRMIRAKRIRYELQTGKFVTDGVDVFDLNNIN